MYGLRRPRISTKAIVSLKSSGEFMAAGLWSVGGGTWSIGGDVGPQLIYMADEPLFSFLGRSTRQTKLRIRWGLRERSLWSMDRSIDLLPQLIHALAITTFEDAEFATAGGHLQVVHTNLVAPSDASCGSHGITIMSGARNLIVAGWTCNRKLWRHEQNVMTQESRSPKMGFSRRSTPHVPRQLGSFHVCCVDRCTGQVGLMLNPWSHGSKMSVSIVTSLNVKQISPTGAMAK
ncbi:hypothetical protein GGX14DRAFT_400682 [Mycena pura]|uniref:Uncharacterized protein n=1 Tax=Mycena pura TaxID=153505 RepID=A0AAD6V1I2_9AGAR|nr:hypothetical protein GGX14DRAFT_400682 [Mycena pura]